MILVLGGTSDSIEICHKLNEKNIDRDFMLFWSFCIFCNGVY